MRHSVSLSRSAQGAQVDKEGELLKELILLLNAEGFVLLVDIEEEGKLFNSSLMRTTRILSSPLALRGLS